MQKGKKKYDSNFKELVVGCYLTCYNYHEVARIMKISVNGAKRIVETFRKNNPRKYAQISTKININGHHSPIKNIANFLIKAPTGPKPKPISPIKIKTRPVNSTL